MTCPVCHRPAVHDLVNPGPEWGPTHRACFARVDALSEALEMAFLAVPLPDLALVGEYPVPAIVIAERRPARRSEPAPRRSRAQARVIARARRRLAAHGIHIEAAA